VKAAAVARTIAGLGETAEVLLSMLPRRSPIARRRILPRELLGRDELLALLRAIHDPPRRLYVRGAADPELFARPAAAVVGAWTCSPYGAQVARMLGRELAAAGVLVFSGLARGVDCEAHRGALETDGDLGRRRPADRRSGQR